MPPKLRRPAAAAGRRAGHRRPATAPEARGAVVWVKSKDLRLEDFATGTNIVVEGEYWEAPVDLCGVVVGALIEGDERYLKVRGGGTHSEAILKFLSGSRGRECQVHLCGDPCEAKVWKDGLVHALRVRKVTGPKEGWMDNLGEVRVEEAEEDQNADLRREAEKSETETPRSGGGSRRRKRREEGFEGAQEKEEEEEREQEVEGVRWPQVVGAGVRRDRSRSRAKCETSGRQESQEVEEGEQEEKKEELEQQHFIDQLFFDVQRWADDRQRDFRGAEGDTENMEESTGHSLPVNGLGGSADPPYPAGHPARGAQGTFASHNGAVFQRKLAAHYDTSSSEGESPLVHAPGSSGPGRNRPRVRPSRPEAEKPRELCPWGDPRHNQALRAGSSGAGIVGYSNRDQPGGKASHGGEQVAGQDTLPRKGVRSASLSQSRKEGESKRRRKEGPRRWQDSEEGQGGRQRQGILRGSRGFVESAWRHWLSREDGRWFHRPAKGREDGDRRYLPG